ncbi:Fc.00g106730.m01.CDS01 [Cosmosporella sp. VM-42]
MPLRPLYPNANADAEGDVAKVDIIAVHGLNPKSKVDSDHAWDTWRTPAGEDGRLWLRDDLPKFLPDARIFLYEYDSTLAYGKDRSTFIDKANMFLEAIRIRRKGVEQRPILLLGHSLGGLLIKQALINAHNNEKYQPIKLATQGLAFFATPHAGASGRLVNIGRIAAKIAISLGFQKGDDILDTLDKEGIFSDIMQEHWKQRLLEYDIVSFWGTLDDASVVPKESTRFGLPGKNENVVALQATHGRVCKFGSSQRDQDNFEFVRGNIEDLYEKALEAARDSVELKKERDKQAEVLNLLRMLYLSNYRDAKSRNRDRVDGTCVWFTTHSLFQHWHQSKTSRFLWVSADPGCGKSVLAKYLADDVLRSTSSRTTCYFFFKDDFEDQRSLTVAICCILRQIFDQRPRLITDEILQKVAKDGERLTKCFLDLWEILVNVAKDPEAGEIVCILDALDECEESGRSQLAAALSRLYWDEPKNFSIKFLLTSRPYFHIQRDLQLLKNRIPTIHLSGESEAEANEIAQEIDCVIRARVEDLGAILSLNQEERQMLRVELTRNPNRTYLWVSLIYDVLRNIISTSPASLRTEIRTIPSTVNGAYEKILDRSPDVEKAKKILHIVVAARRPLSLKEMAVVLAVTKTHQSLDDLAPEHEDQARNTIRGLCGLFLTVVDTRVYLLHQTAKEFLVGRQGTAALKDDSMSWRHSLEPGDSNCIIAEICIWYLLLAYSTAFSALKHSNYALFLQDRPFFGYAASYWPIHFRESDGEAKGRMRCLAIHLCDIRKMSLINWLEVYIRTCSETWPHSNSFPPLKVASLIGLEDVVQQFLKVGETDTVEEDGSSALRWAVANKQGGVAKVLLSNPLGRNVTDEVVEWLILKGPGFGREGLYAVNSGHSVTWAPLLAAARSGRSDVCEALLGTGMFDNEALNDNGLAPIHLAASGGHEGVIKLFLDSRKVDINLEDRYGRTAIFIAASHGHVGVVELLLYSGKADLKDQYDQYNQTPISVAASRGHLDIVKLLLDSGNAKLATQDSLGRAPIHLAAAHGHEDVVKLLLDSGKVDAKVKDYDGQTPLQGAIQYGTSGTAKLLSDWIKAKDEESEIIDSILSSAPENKPLD